LLPRLSGINNLFSFNMHTNPGASPRGVASQLPDLSAEEMTTKGDNAMKSTQ
jgi:hypothetical protein